MNEDPLKREAAAVILHQDFELSRALLRMETTKTRSTGVFLNIVESLTDDLQQLQRNFRFGGIEEVAARKRCARCRCPAEIAPPCG